jgi:hypothetical protein
MKVVDVVKVAEAAVIVRTVTVAVEGADLVVKTDRGFLSETLTSACRSTRRYKPEHQYHQCSTLTITLRQRARTVSGLSGS